MEELRAALALQMTDDIGPATGKKLIEHFGSPSRIFRADREEILSIDGLGIKKASKICSFTAWGAIDGVLEECLRKNIHILYYGLKEYPELLKQIVDPPLVLYYKGALSDLDRFAIAMVGSRHATPYGKSAAQNIAEGLASMGLTIVSGIARGIDSISHMGALQQTGRTLAVLGSGIDVIYPPESRGLYERIQHAGAVLSEFPLGTPPNRENFPQRNRAISGLSLGVIVIEAAKGSGTLITAQSALEQNREVFAVPGNIYSSNSYGTNDLIKRGAKVLTHPDDVVHELGHLLKGFIRAEQRRTVEITTEEQEICDILSGEPMHIDDITRKAGHSPSTVLARLLGLELKSAVKQLEGKMFYLVQEEQRV